jgi:hypothetical protein
MSETFKRASLIEMQPSFEAEKPDGHKVEVQFNPESLKLTFANQLVQPEGGDQAAGNAGRQFVGAGTTKLALSLWFDVTAMEKEPVDDVRRLTQKVLFFMTPQPADDDPEKLVPPAVRFSWGSFVFDGMVEGVEETIELFSDEGKALRAGLSLTLSQQKILETNFAGDGRVPNQPGRTPLTPAQQGDTLQRMAAGKGKNNWQSIAAANGIEDPLRPSPGQLVDLSAGVSGGVPGGFSASTSLGGGASARASAGASIGASIATGVPASIRIGASANAEAALNTALGGGLGASFGGNN